MGKKGKGGKKAGKGSAKGKRGGGSAKPAEPEVPEGPVFLWTKEAEAWMSKARIRRDRLRKHFRHHYLFSEAIVWSQEEWCRNLLPYAHEFEDEHTEAMVQLLVTLLAREGDGRRPADDYYMFAAALRQRHGRQHFARMRDEFLRYTADLDAPDKAKKLLQCLQPSEFADDGHVEVDKLTRKLAQLGLTKTQEPEVIEGEAGERSDRVDIMEIFQDFVTKNRLRLVDMFLNLDKDRSGEITKEEFINGLSTENVPLSDEALDELISALDVDGDGMINYQEFSLGRNDAVLAKRERMRPVEEAEDVIVGEKKVITMDIDDLSILTLHVHYITRP